MYIRTFGWVQNPSNFINLKRTVQIFNPNSAHYERLRDYLVEDRIVHFDDIRANLQEKLDQNESTFNYTELVGRSINKHGSPAKRRAEAEANALIQISWLPQQWKRTGKKFTDDWTSDGFLRWAVSLNFVQHDRATDLFSLTELGREFSETADYSEDEQEILTEALLRYPPATQVLQFLSEHPGTHTKFAIGENLGFRGERGFTSYDESLMIDWLKSASRNERSKIRSDVEGTSDKYARMICTWLRKLDLVSLHSEKISNGAEQFNNFLAYQITGKGSHAIRQAHGSSSNRRVEKFVMWEFLATDGVNRDYIRSRRAYIINILQETESFNVLKNRLAQLGFDDDEPIIINDLKGLQTFGLRIDINGNQVRLLDAVSGLSIPDLPVTEIIQDKQIERQKELFLRHTNLEPKYIELLEIAYDGTRSRDFEMITAELFKRVFQLDSMFLGGARKPDGIVFTDEFGIITDTKSYRNGYARSINQADQMIRYIEDNKRRDSERNPTEWWTLFHESIPADNFYFLWISSYFNRGFDEQLTYTANETNTNGGALSVVQLLIGADLVLKGELDPMTLPDYIHNREVIFKEDIDWLQSE